MPTSAQRRLRARLRAPLLLLGVLGLDLLIGSLTLDTGTPAPWRFENTPAAAYDPARVAELQASGEGVRWVHLDGLWRLTPLSSHLLNVDAFGERRTTGNVSGGPTVAVLGGSAAFGMGQADDATLASNMAALLNDGAGSAVTVRNFATPGWTTFEAAKDLEQRLLRGDRFDVVVAYSGANELYLALLDERIPTTLLDVTYERSGAPSDSVAEHWLDRSLLARLGGREPRAAKTPLRVVGERVSMVFGAASDRVGGKRVLESARFNYREGDRMLRGLADRYGFSVLHVLQPMRSDGSTGPLTAVKGSMLAEVPGVLDLSGSLEDRCFFDDVHTSEPCSRRLAELVVHELAERGFPG